MLTSLTLFKSHNYKLFPAHELRLPYNAVFYISLNFSCLLCDADIIVDSFCPLVDLAGGKGYFVKLQGLTSRNETAILFAKSGSRAGILKDY